MIRFAMLSHHTLPPTDSTKISPLYVDLDGTLAATDTLWESSLLLFKQIP